MPPDHRSHPDKETPAKDYDIDPRWRSKPLTPQQLLVTDVQYDTLRPDRGPMLELNERAASTLIPDTAAFTPSASYVRISSLTDNPIERQTFNALENDYGWMRHLRLDADDPAKVRWVHCSSTFPEYLSGFLWAFSEDPAVAEHLRILESAISRETRFSKHGKHFAPFAQTLRPPSENDGSNSYPLLISIPFLDWTVQGATPPLRFQVDRREGFLSARSSAHITRSILQHFYRLEDTADRESSQVFAKHKPWTTNRELNLKVRQWYVCRFRSPLHTRGSSFSNIELVVIRSRSHGNCIGTQGILPVKVARQDRALLFRGLVLVGMTMSGCHAHRQGHL